MSDNPTPILHRAHQAIRSNPHLAGRNLFVEHEHGGLTLRGNVMNFYQKQMAQEAIRSIDPMVSIDNRLVVMVERTAG
jgi:osmotically-inducible protein OsmY